MLRKMYSEDFMIEKLLTVAGEIAQEDEDFLQSGKLLFKRDGFVITIEAKNANKVCVQVNWTRWGRNFCFGCSTNGNEALSRKELWLILRALCREEDERGLGRDPMLGYDRKTLKKMGKLNE